MGPANCRSSPVIGSERLLSLPDFSDHMGCAGSSPVEPDGDGQSMLFWPPDEAAHKLAPTRTTYNNLPTFRFCQTLINQEAISNALLGRAATQLPYPPDDA